jgi:hypothetical protein
VDIPSLVRVRIATTPEDAELSLDGARVPNPFDTSMPRGGKHRAVARADGYHSRELALKFDADQNLTMKLDKRPQPGAGRTTASTSPAVPTPRARSRVASPPPQRALALPPPRKAPALATPSGKGAAFVTESPY